MPLTEDERNKFKHSNRKRAFAVWTGELLEITYSPGIQLNRRHGRRTAIKGFTRGARLRMLRMIASINWGNVRHGVFITLTYPDSCAERTLRERSTDKYLFLRYMEKHLGKKVGVIWRLEWEPRKTGKRKGQLIAHWHLIVFGVRWIDKDIVKQYWRAVLRADGPLITWIDGIKGGRKLAKYVSKYCSKLPGDSVLDDTTYLNTLGRHWGVNRRELVPWFPRFLIPFLTEADVNLAENLACMTFAYFNRGAQQGFQIFGRNALKVGEILFERMIDIEDATE